MPALPPERPGCPNAPGGHRPLPDPAAVRLCLVPDSAPPYDDEVPAAEPPGRGGDTAGRARPAAGATVPRATATRATVPPATVPPGTATSAMVLPGTVPPDTPTPVTRPATGGPGTGESAAGAAASWQSRFAQVLAETLAGSRPPRQIAPWTTQQAREHILRLGPRMASVQRPRVRRVVTFRPASDVMEMAVVVGFGPRVRALALRLERSATRPPTGQEEPTDHWVCTAVEAA